MFCRTDHGGSASVELGVDHVVVADWRAMAVTRRPLLPVAAARWGRLQPVKHLLQFGCQRLHPVQRGLVLDGLPSVGDQHLGAGPVMWRRGVAKLGEAALDLVSRRIEFI